MMLRVLHGPVRLGCICFCLLVSSYSVLARRHNLTLKDDVRKNFAVSTFGFMKGGALMVDVSEFSFDGEKAGDFLFSIEKTASDGVSNYLEHHTEKCRLNQENTQDQVSLMLLELDLAKERMNVRRLGQDFHKIGVSEKRLENKAFSHQATITSYAHKASGISTINPSCPRLHEWHTELKLKKEKKGNSFQGVFTICMNETAHEGLYNVFFHNCANYDKSRKSKIKVNLVLNIIEHNDGTYLSAGEIPLPILYGLMSVAFFVIGCTWVVFLNRHRDWMYKVHYVMAVLTFLKSFSLAFHAVNFYYIGKDGRPMESWAVLYYITHLLKGALLFTTIVLIGTGFFFVKHILSTKEKRIFMIVIPLQILTNVAQIMTESIEEGKAQYTTWHQIFVLVDLICCGAVLFPVVWSIRHLQEAAKTDGKAATSLAKLKLFRHFYVMIVCYIYFTRIIVYLIKITVPFKFMWLDEFFTELGTFVFFILTGYKFRPAPANPYLHVPGDDSEDDIEMNEITMQSGMAEGLTRVQSASRRAEMYAA